MLGVIPCGHLRLPLVDATSEERDVLTGLLEAQGLLVNAS
jgi:hypothetical protein